MKQKQSPIELDEFIVIGDRILIQPRTTDNRTSTGLYLPPGVREKEEIGSGYILKTGPGYPIPASQDDENWNPTHDAVKYIPLQVEAGDLAIYLKKQAYEIQFKNEKYLIISQSAVLLVIRDEGLFE